MLAAGRIEKTLGAKHRQSRGITSHQWFADQASKKTGPPTSLARFEEFL